MIGRLLALRHRLEKRRHLRRPLEERIARSAQQLRENGISALAALAAAEAVEVGLELGYRYDDVTFDEKTLRWSAHYETGPIHCPEMVTLPLTHATEATQRGLAVLN